MKRRIAMAAAFLLVVGLIALTTIRMSVPAKNLELVSAAGDGTRITVVGKINSPLRCVAGIEYENTADGKTKIRVLSTYRIVGQKEFTVNVNNSEGTVKEILFYDKKGGTKSVWQGELAPVSPPVEPIPDTEISGGAPDPAE